MQIAFYIRSGTEYSWNEYQFIPLFECFSFRCRYCECRLFPATVSAATQPTEEENEEEYDGGNVAINERDYGRTGNARWRLQRPLD